MSWQEVLGSILGVINIVLLVRRSVWNFPVAMAMVSLVGVVLFDNRLYSEAGLQVFFFVVNGWGWWLWSRAKGGPDGSVAPDDGVPVEWLGWSARAVWLAVTAVCSLALGWVMHRFTNAALPFADSAITGASIAAQFLLSWRKIENWVLWVVIDIASVCLYAWRGLWLFAALYVLFGVLSVMGLREWTRAEADRARKPGEVRA